MDLRGVVVGNRYTMEREIGRGGMATVWSANDQQHGRKVAIKVLHPDLAGAVGTDRFLREVRLTAELQHPAVVPILDSGAFERDGVRIPWYAMPYLEGETLRARLTRETQLPIDEALRIVNGVGKAVAAAHRRNIVHRDLKPENVFLSGDHVYVVDFGIAKAVAATDDDRLTSTGLAIGTPTYMSPEQALGGAVDARSDQYSLAVMLYEMLAGEPPFAGPNQQATIARRLAERARPISTVRSTVPPAVERATLRALERTPADRFPSVDAFLAALSAPSASVRVRPLSRRTVASLAGVVIIAAAAAVWWMTRGPSVDPEVLALYQRGVQGYDRRNAAGAIDAIRALTDAIRRDSSFAPAWNALAKTYVRAFERGFEVPDIAKSRLIPLAVDAVDRALTLEKSSADVWTTHAIVSLQVAPWDLATPRRSLERSLELDSLQAVAWHFFARVNAEEGDLATGLDAWRRSVQLAPSYTQGLAFLALGHYWHGAYDSAAVWADSVVQVDNSYILGRQTAALIEVERGRFTEAEDQAQAALRLSEDVERTNSWANLALVKARAGNANLARADILAAEVSGSNYLPLLHTAVYLAEAKAAVGDIEGALKSLGRYGTRRDMHFQLHVRCSPTFAPLENDPRFRAMLVIPRPPRGSHC